MRRLNVHDEAAFDAWLQELRTTLLDLEAVVADLFRRKRGRRLGHRQAKQIATESIEKLDALLAEVAPLPEPTDLDRARARRALRGLPPKK